MKINISTSNIILEEELRDYIIKRINNLDRLFSEPEVYCDLKIGFKSSVSPIEQYFVEAKIITPTNSFYTREDSKTAMEAVDKVKDELFRIVTKEKSKKNSLLKRSGRKAKDFLKNILHK